MLIIAAVCKKNEEFSRCNIQTCDHTDVANVVLVSVTLFMDLWRDDVLKLCSFLAILPTSLSVFAAKRKKKLSVELRDGQAENNRLLSIKQTSFTTRLFRLLYLQRGGKSQFNSLAASS